jgi:hypothetical protein
MIRDPGPGGSSDAVRARIDDLRRPGPLRLWTIQREEAWLEALRRGALRGDGRRVWRGHRAAYRWLMEQMAVRLPRYSGGYPVWCWYHPKPDLRRSAHLPSGVRGVCIELAVPASRVLALDFDAWHAVLNGFTLSLTREEDDAWDARLARSPRPKSRERAALREEMRRGWERVFDLDALMASEWVGPVTHIQAVVERVPLREVVRVRGFRAR